MIVWFKHPDPNKNSFTTRQNKVIRCNQGYTYVTEPLDVRELRHPRTGFKVLDISQVPDFVIDWRKQIEGELNKPTKIDEIVVSPTPKPQPEPEKFENILGYSEDSYREKEYDISVILIYKNEAQYEELLALASDKLKGTAEVIICDNGNKSIRNNVDGHDWGNRVHFYTNKKYTSSELAERAKRIANGERIYFAQSKNKLIELNKKKDDTKVKTKSKVSIITTTYDRPKCVKSLLSSHERMSEKSIEVIIINDGTFKNNITKEISDSKINNLICVHYACNKGLYPAQNVGYKLATGEFICTIDDDDVYTKDGIKNMLSHFDDELEVVFARCTRYKKFEKPIAKETFPITCSDLSERNIFISNWNHASARMFRRSCLDKVGLNDLSFKWLNDWEFGIRLVRSCKCKSVSDLVSIVKLEDTGMTRTCTRRDIWMREAGRIGRKNVFKKVVDSYNQITISIIIPLYNTSEWCLRSVESALKCSKLHKVQVVLIDDCSPENEYEILKGMIKDVDNNIVYKRLPKNKGISGALNAGIKLCEGDYIGFHGADDELYEGKMDLLVDELSDPNIVLAYGDADSLDEFGQRRLRQPEYDKEALLINNYIGKFMLWKADVLKKTGLFNWRLKVALDWDMWIRMSNYGDFKHVKEAVGMQRVHDKCTHVTKYDVCTKEIKRLIKKHTGKTNFKLNGHSVEWGK